ncbi:MAG: hypothetical protein K2I56_04645 [Muribaculaceae bacterium]|nr:hypothetical protein [Muribaculaceae bacterium]
MPGGNWPAPLAFYCSDTGIVVGEDALRAAHAGTSNAFDNYFKRIVEDSTYTIGGQTRPIRNLLLDASELIFSDFFRLVLFNRYGSLSDNRANVPLVIACESDIRPNERVLLQELFKDSGYNRVKVVEYDRYIGRFIRESLSKECACDNVLVAWTEGADLTLSLFNVNDGSGPVVQCYENLGIDPRKDYVKDMIWKSVIYQNQWLPRDNEENTLDKLASDFLCSSQPLVNGMVTLSDGGTYHYSLNRSTIDCIQSPDSVSLRESLDRFLRDNDIANREGVLLLLRGNAAGNSYFERNLSPGFSRTIRTDKKLRNNTMSLLIAEVIPPAEADLIVPEIPDIMTAAPVSDNKTIVEMPEQVVNHDAIKALERQWREVKAAAKGKIRSGNSSDARTTLNKFLDTVKKENGADALIASIEKELSLIVYEEPKPARQKHKDGDIHPNGKWVWVSSAAGGKGDWRTIGGRIHKQANEAVKNLNSGTDPDNVRTLLQQGKLKEARDWYREQQNHTQARILTEIIRTQKGVRLRQSGIDEYRKTKNREQINRIIKEIQDFIGLCESAGVNAAEYKKLLAEYRKI